MKGKQHLNKMKSIARTRSLSIVVAACWFVFSGCVYNIPITSKPIGKIDVRLLGHWTSKDGKDKLKVVKLDDYNYIVANTDGNLYRVWRSDVADTPFVSVLNLETDKPQYSYWTWKLSDDGTLILRLVNDKVIPDDTKSSVEVRKLIKKNLQNPALFGDEMQMTKDK
jgi:hypothetical protein